MTRLNIQDFWGYGELYLTSQGRTTLQYCYPDDRLDHEFENSLLKVKDQYFTFSQYQQLINTPRYPQPEVENCQVSGQFLLNQEKSTEDQEFLNHIYRLKIGYHTNFDQYLAMNNTYIYCKYPDNREFSFNIFRDQVSFKARSDFDWFNSCDSLVINQRTNFDFYCNRINRWIHLRLDMGVTITDQELRERLKRLSEDN